MREVKNYLVKTTFSLSGTLVFEGSRVYIEIIEGENILGTNPRLFDHTGKEVGPVCDNTMAKLTNGNFVELIEE